MPAETKQPRQEARTDSDRTRTPARTDRGSNARSVPTLTPKVNDHLGRVVLVLDDLGVDVQALAGAVHTQDQALPELLARAVEAGKAGGKWDTLSKGSKSMATSLLRYLRGEVPVYAADKRAEGVIEANTRGGRTSVSPRASVPDEYVECWLAMDSVQRGDFIARAYRLGVQNKAE